MLHSAGFDKEINNYFRSVFIVGEMVEREAQENINRIANSPGLSNYFFKFIKEEMLHTKEPKPDPEDEPVIFCRGRFRDFFVMFFNINDIIGVEKHEIWIRIKNDANCKDVFCVEFFLLDEQDKEPFATLEVNLKGE